MRGMEGPYTSASMRPTRRLELRANATATFTACKCEHVKPHAACGEIPSFDNGRGRIHLTLFHLWKELHVGHFTGRGTTCAGRLPYTSLP